MNHGLEIHAQKIGGGVSRYTQNNVTKTVEQLQNGGCAAQVYSAIRDSDFNATDNLIELARLLNIGNKEAAAGEKLSYIMKQTQRIISAHYTKFDEDTQLQRLIAQEFEDLNYYIALYDNDEPLSDINDFGGRYSIMGFGENLTTKIYAYLLQKQGVDVVYLDTQGLKQTGEIKDIGELLCLMKKKLKEVLGDGSPRGKVIISSGFIENLLGGINGMIGRGFTDTVTGLVALCLLDTNSFEKVVFEIQKDVMGVLSTNPNDLKNAPGVKLIEKLSIEFAIRIFGEHGANSGLLNKATINDFVIKALQEEPRFSVEIKNPDAIDGKKTTIQKEVEIKYPA